jgi:hypothetical protein
MSHRSEGARAPAVSAVEVSENRKLGPVSATYVSQRSCPPDCPLLLGGCYAEWGHTGVHARRLNRSTVTSPLALAREEARAIDRLSGARDLRLHVVGDARTEAAARLLAESAERYVLRGGGRSKVWTYTHAWRTVSRAAWGASVSVLASCEGPGQVEQARARGYAAALVVPSFRQEAAYDHDGVRLLPCPEQTRGVRCSDCRLCLDDHRLHRAGLTIGFALHGAGAARARLALPVLP